MALTHTHTHHKHMTHTPHGCMGATYMHTLGTRVTLIYVHTTHHVRAYIHMTLTHTHMQHTRVCTHHTQAYTTHR